MNHVSIESCFTRPSTSLIQNHFYLQLKMHLDPFIFYLIIYRAPIKIAAVVVIAVICTEIPALCGDVQANVFVCDTNKSVPSFGKMLWTTDLTRFKRHFMIHFQKNSYMTKRLLAFLSTTIQNKINWALRALGAMHIVLLSRQTMKYCAYQRTYMSYLPVCKRTWGCSQIQ